MSTPLDLPTGSQVTVTVTEARDGTPLRVTIEAAGGRHLGVIDLRVPGSAAHVGAIVTNALATATGPVGRTYAPSCRHPVCRGHLVCQHPNVGGGGA